MFPDVFATGLLSPAAVMISVGYFTVQENNYRIIVVLNLVLKWDR